MKAARLRIASPIAPNSSIHEVSMNSKASASIAFKYPSVDLTGQTFNFLRVIRNLGIRNHQRWWLCLCECGKHTRVPTSRLRNGNTGTCGCRKRIHGMTHSPEYSCWSHMKDRCVRPQSRYFDRYGGRGITVDPEWVKSFAVFYADMGPRPKGTSLDRIDNDGPYAKWNCRWADWKTQRRNRPTLKWSDLRDKVAAIKLSLFWDEGFLL